MSHIVVRHYRITAFFIDRLHHRNYNDSRDNSQWLQTKFAVILVLLFLPMIVHAQVDRTKCLVDGSDDNRVSGTLVYVEFPYETRPEITIKGYKLLLLKPRCFETVSLETEKAIRGDIAEIAIRNWFDNRQFPARSCRAAHDGDRRHH